MKEQLDTVVRKPHLWTYFHSCKILFFTLQDLVNAMEDMTCGETAMPFVEDMRKIWLNRHAMTVSRAQAANVDLEKQSLRLMVGLLKCPIQGCNSRNENTAIERESFYKDFKSGHRSLVRHSIVCIVPGCSAGSPPNVEALRRHLDGHYEKLFEPKRFNESCYGKYTLHSYNKKIQKDCPFLCRKEGCEDCRMVWNEEVVIMQHMLLSYTNRMREVLEYGISNLLEPLQDWKRKRRRRQALQSTHHQLNRSRRTYQMMRRMIKRMWAWRKVGMAGEVDHIE